MASKTKADKLKKYIALHVDNENANESATAYKMAKKLAITLGLDIDNEIERYKAGQAVNGTDESWKVFFSTGFTTVDRFEMAMHHWFFNIALNDSEMVVKFDVLKDKYSRWRYAESAMSKSTASKRKKEFTDQAHYCNLPFLSALVLFYRFGEIGLGETVKQWENYYPQSRKEAEEMKRKNDNWKYQGFVSPETEIKTETVKSSEIRIAKKGYAFCKFCGAEIKLNKLGRHNGRHHKK